MERGYTIRYMHIVHVIQKKKKNKSCELWTLIKLYKYKRVDKLLLSTNLI